MRVLRRYSLSMIFMLCGYIAAAQHRPVVRVYAYQRVVVPGTVPQVLNEDGTVTKKKTADNYYRYIYLEHKRSHKNIKLLKVWINGKPYAANTEKVTGTPVIVTNGDMAKDTLVPKTYNTVLQVVPGQAIQNGSAPASLKESIARNELVIVYACGKRSYHFDVRQLKNLSSFILQ